MFWMQRRSVNLSNQLLFSEDFADWFAEIYEDNCNAEAVLKLLLLEYGNYWNRPTIAEILNNFSMFNEIAG